MSRPLIDYVIEAKAQFLLEIKQPAVEVRQLTRIGSVKHDPFQGDLLVHGTPPLSW